MKPQLSHVGIYCHDCEAMIRFYEEVLGLTVTDRGLSTSAKQPIIFHSINIFLSGGLSAVAQQGL